MNPPPGKSLERSDQIREQVEREFACQCESKLIVVKVQKNGLASPKVRKLTRSAILRTKFT